VEIEWRRPAKRTFRIISGILSHILRFEYGIAMQAVNILPHLPFMDWITGVQPTDSVFSIHINFGYGQSLSSSNPHLPPPLRGGSRWELLPR
jgi:hypothetical protein